MITIVLFECVLFSFSFFRVLILLILLYYNVIVLSLLILFYCNVIILSLLILFFCNVINVK